MRTLIFLICIFPILAQAQLPISQRQYYNIPFFEGLNVVTDSIVRDNGGMRRNEAIQLDNFVLDRFGALHKRYGIVNWNASLLSTGKTWDIHYVDDKNGDQMLFFAANIYIYERKSWEDTTDIYGNVWNGMEVDYSRGIIDTAENGQRYIYGDTTSWILAVDIDDIIEFEGDDTQRWVIDSVLADTLLHISANLTSAHGDTTTYRILKHIPRMSDTRPGRANLASWGGKLYVADGVHEPWWYDGVQPQLLGVIDSGTVTGLAVVDTTAEPYSDSTGTAILVRGSNIVRLEGISIGDTAFEVGNTFHAVYHVPTRGLHFEFSSRITGRNATNDTSIYLANAVRWICAPDDFCPQMVIIENGVRASEHWWIDAKYTRLTTEQNQYLEDSTKFFPVGSDINYIGLWIINGRDATTRGYISSNTEKGIRFDYTPKYPLAIKITPSSANNSYAYEDTINSDASPSSWTSPGSGTTIEMVCDSMVKYVNADADVNSSVTAYDSTTFYILEADALGGYFTVRTDTAQDTLTTVAFFFVGDRYYVVRQIPELRHPVIGWGYSPYPDPFGDDPYPPIGKDTAYTELTFFKEIIFHRNRLYAIGYGIVPKAAGGFAVGDTVNTGRVWFSALGQPRLIHSDWNFDLSGVGKKAANSLYSGDDATTLFILKDDLYVITRSNIYRISGEPPDDLYISQIIHGVGTDQPNGVVTTKDNVAYIMNSQGIWYFDGDTIEKISYRIDPLMEKYRASRMTAGKFKDNLLFSYPDSNVTLVMHYPTKGFTFWNVGMLTINDQSVAIDSNYFLFARAENSAYVLKYPRDYAKYIDSWTPTDTAVVVAHYLSGQMIMDTYKNKMIEDIDITAYAVNAMDGFDFLNYLGVRADFADTSDWSETAFAQTDPINSYANIGVWGKAFQIQVKDSTDQDFFLSSYGIRWYPVER